MTKKLLLPIAKYTMRYQNLMGQVLLGSVFGAANLCGAALMLDFGNSGAYTGIDSPAHAEGAVSASYSTWTQVGGAGTGGITVTNSLSVNLSYYDGRAAGLTQSDSTGIIEWARDGATVSHVGGTGIWGTSLTSDSLVDITSANRRDPMAVAVSGFAAGLYDVYVITHHAGNLTVPLDVKFGVLSAAPISTTTTTFSDLTGPTVSLLPNVGNGDTAWTLGSDYAKYRVTITSLSEALVVAVNNPNNTSTGVANQASISSLQVVAVPEPSTYVLIMGVVALCGIIIRRRIRR